MANQRLLRIVELGCTRSPGAGLGWVLTVRLFEGEAAEARQATLAVLRQAFEAAGVEFIEENGGGPGLRLRKRPRAKPPK